jgi:hypothetical protein
LASDLRLTRYTVPNEPRPRSRPNSYLSIFDFEFGLVLLHASEKNNEKWSTNRINNIQEKQTRANNKHTTTNSFVRFRSRFSAYRFSALLDRSSLYCRSKIKVYTAN